MRKISVDKQNIGLGALRKTQISNKLFFQESLNYWENSSLT